VVFGEAEERIGYRADGAFVMARRSEEENEPVLEQCIEPRNVEFG